jgi:ABC-2 type transport system ATP-binding protein
MNPAIEIQDLTKTFSPHVVAVTGVDLVLPRGSLFGLLGRNGAGKTTMLRLVMGLLCPDCGSARVLGHNLGTAPSRLRQKVAYVAQALQLPGWLTLEDLGRCLARMYDRWDDRLIDRLGAQWDLPKRRSLAELSGGQQRQAALALALAVHPEVLLLDEPAAGLDPVARRALLRCLVEALGDGDECTMVICTHQIADLERVANQVGFMDRGRLVMNAPLETILQSTRRVQVIFDQPCPPPGFAIPGARHCQTVGPVMTAVVQWTHEDQLAALSEWPGVRVNVFPMNLEEIFLDQFEMSELETEAMDA